MERVLLLEETGLPVRFNSVEVSPPPGISKISYVENKILNEINRYNPKMKLTDVVYGALEDIFPGEESSKFTGFIIERKKISRSQENDYKELDFTIWNDSNQLYAMRILAYVFFTIPKEQGRNILVAQTIFPELIDFMEKYMPSPSYTISNRPIYFINIINKIITANSVLKPLIGIIKSDINYVEAFPGTIKPGDIPKTLQEFVQNYEVGYNVSHHNFSSDYYEVNFNLKKLKIKTDKLVLGHSLISNGRYIDFRGSDEKFYWIQILPVFLMACKEGYSIDYSELENFYSSNLNGFSDRSTKLPRFLVLLKFMEKVTFN